MARYKIEVGIRQSIASFFKYLLIIIGLITILQNSNVDLSALGILAGAIGVGIGFGLQNITNNFISGLIILLERPIKVGDRIEVDEVYGDVEKYLPDPLPYLPMIIFLLLFRIVNLLIILLSIGHTMTVI